jgi:hypothetical protein
LRVLGAAAVLALVTGVLAGPAGVTRVSPEPVSGFDRRRARDERWAIVRNAWVVLEVALTVVLLACAALFIGSFRSLRKSNLASRPITY